MGFVHRLFLFIVLFSASAQAESFAPLVDLDASALSVGPVTAWKNSGSLGGEFDAQGIPAPIAADVGGRRAVNFGGNSWLASSFRTPYALVGAKPFSLVVSAYVPAAVKRDIMVSWASRPIGSAEFGFGGGPAGAFFGWDKSAGYKQVPAAGTWHQIAYTSESNQFRIYVDGIQDTSRELTIAPKAGGHIQLGAGRDGTGQKPIAFFHGSLARVEIWDQFLSQREVRNAGGSFDPFNAVPGDGATVPAEGAALLWEAGSADAASFAVRISKTLADAQADGAESGDVRTVNPDVSSVPLAPGTTYFWRVDQLNAAGQRIVKGPVWRFTVDSGPATVPFPRDKVAGVLVDVRQLTWTPGRYAQSQTVYFGPDERAVADGSAAMARALPATATACAIPGDALEYGKTYYWRVAENNGAIAGAPGVVWAFRTADRQNHGDVTFFVGSDCHYGLGNNDELNRRVIDEMNWLPGTDLPRQVGGGIVQTPRGLVLNGDLLDKGYDPKTAPADWAEFTRDYGLLGTDGRLGYPVFEGFGNHDGMTGVSVSRAGIQERNKLRRGLTMVSANGYHYSWDWDDLHLVQLNLFPGKDSGDCIVGPPNHDPEDSLGFLKEDLAKNVGDSGRVVIVFCHFCYAGGMSDWWTQDAKDRFYQAIQGYRVVLIHGHSHGAYTYHWHGVLVISDGATARPESQTGDFMVVHFTSDGLTVAQRKFGEWGLTLKAPLPDVTAAGVP